MDISKKINDTKIFFKKHKGKIAAVVIVLLSGVCIFLKIDNEQLKEMNKKLLKNNIDLEDLVNDKSARITNLESENAAKALRIASLEDLCIEKDGYYLRAISELLRRGSSEGARQMAYRRWS